MKRARAVVLTSWPKTIGLGLPMMFLTALMLSGGKAPADPKRWLALIAVFVFTNVLFLLMLRRGKTDQPRATLFIVYALMFVFTFIAHLIELRGSMVLKAANVAACETPFCHMVIPMTLVPAAFTDSIIFPGRILGGFASIASMFVIWIGASLALGRGWCSWGCFFGGLDEGFSRLLKRPIIRKIDPKWSYVSFAVLLSIVLTSALWLYPTYCSWLCPYKAVTEFQEVTSARILVQTIIFVSLFLGLVILLPVLSKRRIQCGLFCPFGAFQSFTNKINPFEVRIDLEKCKSCQLCLKNCPTFSISEESLKEGRTRITCAKCGKCVDNCPTQAISYHVKGSPLSTRPYTARLLFLYPAFLFLTIMAGADVVEGVARLLNLVLHGSVLLT
ncbi:MAG: 4Fe-4S binding protein [Thermodesulfobacteriota bacterium]